MRNEMRDLRARSQLELELTTLKRKRRLKAHTRGRAGVGAPEAVAPDSGEYGARCTGSDDPPEVPQGVFSSLP